MIPFDIPLDFPLDFPVDFPVDLPWISCGFPGCSRSSTNVDVAFTPGATACYDGAFHSRRFGDGTKVSEELVLASVDQLLPLLLLPFAARHLAMSHDVAMFPY